MFFCQCIYDIINLLCCFYTVFKFCYMVEFTPGTNAKGLVGLVEMIETKAWFIAYVKKAV